jgi:integrase
MIDHNPCELIEKPKVHKKEMKIWSSEQLLKFKEVSKDYYLEAAMHLLMYGLRRGEILGLTIENLHLDEGYISIRNNLVITSDGIRLESTTKTSASSRDIPIAKDTIELLRKHIGNKKAGLVFTTSEGNYIHPRSFQRSFDMLLKKASLPKIRLHDMRHSSCSLLITNGCDLKTVSQLIGHANTRVTTDIYLHSTMANKRQAINILDSLLTKKA